MPSPFPPQFDYLLRNKFTKHDGPISWTLALILFDHHNSCVRLVQRLCVCVRVNSVPLLLHIAGQDVDRMTKLVICLIG